MPSDGGHLEAMWFAAREGYFDNYQVKKFAANLDGSQKCQIVESLKRARDTHNDPSRRGGAAAGLQPGAASRSPASASRWA
jgi:hypothetical protein